MCRLHNVRQQNKTFMFKALRRLVSVFNECEITEYRVRDLRY